MKQFALLLILISLPAIAVDHNHGHKSETQKQRKTISSAEKDFIINVLSENDKIFNALLSEKNDQIEQQAKELVALFEQNNDPIFKDVKLKAKKLSELKTANKHEDNLKAYEEFLKPLIEIVLNYNVGASYNVFSCSMVKKSWLQDIRFNKGVKNVFATYMLECGTQDTGF